jgi:hypothetical protein
MKKSKQPKVEPLSLFNSNLLISVDKVDAIEKQTGWNIHTCNDTHPTFVYKKTLFLYIAADFQESPITLVANQPISLTYNPPKGLYRKDETYPPTIHRFFVQHLQARLPTMSYTVPSPKLKSVLDLVSSGWDLTSMVYQEAARIRFKFHTIEKIIDDSTLMIQSMVLLKEPKEISRQTKILAQFFIKLKGEASDLEYDLEIKLLTVYGQQFMEQKMIEFITKRIRGPDGKLQIKGWRQALEAMKTAMLKGQIETIGIYKPVGK